MISKLFYGVAFFSSYLVILLLGVLTLWSGLPGFLYYTIIFSFLVMVVCFPIFKNRKPEVNDEEE